MRYYCSKTSYVVDKNHSQERFFVPARQNFSKKRNLRLVNEYFERYFNAAGAKKMNCELTFTPFSGITWHPFHPHLKIKRTFLLPTAAADRCNHFTFIDPVTGFFI